MSEVFFTDPELCARWRCSKMKLWRLRQAGKLHSIQLGGRGYPWLTSDEEVARVEGRPVFKDGRTAA